MEFDHSCFYNVGGPYIVRLQGDISKFDDSISAFRRCKDIFVSIMRGERMTTKKEVLNEIASSLQFPWYFGGNWDALDECINDLSWLYSTKFVVAITNSEFILSSGSDNDKLILGKLLFDACENWSKPYREEEWFGRPGRPFHILMHFGDETVATKFGDIFQEIDLH